MNIKNSVLIPNRHLPTDFSEAVKTLTRPYIPLTSEEVRYIKTLAKEANTDFLQDENGCVYTWGLADGYIHRIKMEVLKWILKK